METTPSGQRFTTVSACPECGGDCGVLRDTSRGWSHASRVIPNVVLLALILGVIGYWISIGTVGYFTQMVELRRSVGSGFRAAAVPWVPSVDHDPVYLSTDDMERAIVGDEMGLDRVKGTLQTIVDRVDANRGVAGLMGVRFSLKESGAVVETTTTHRLGGVWVTQGHSNTVWDIRDLDSLDPDHSSDWERVQWTLFPKFSYTKQSTDTSRGSTRGQLLSIHWRPILGVLSVCMLLAWLIRWGGVRYGVVPFEKRYAWSTTVALLFATCAVGATLNSSVHREASSITSQSSQFTPMYPIATIRELAADSSRAIDWCRDQLGLLPEGENADLLLGQHWIFDESMAGSAHQMELQSYIIAISSDYPLFSWGRGLYAPEVANEDVSAATGWGMLRVLRDQGALSLSWGPSRESNAIFVHMIPLALIAVSFYWLWVVFHWVSRKIMGFVQFRRVWKKQCIYCKYPLTEEGLEARLVTLEMKPLK